MEGVDRLNELKDEMIVNNIMSRFDCTTKELIRTTATISKRWRNLWTQLPHLIFIDEDDVPGFGFGSDLHDYISFIDNILNHCPTNLNLKRFKIDINYISCLNHSEFKSQANNWIHYAISRNVEDVDLRLCVGEPFSYDDELLFNNLCFNRVKLSWCVLNPPNGTISWERLKCLCLSWVSLGEDTIEKILSGSPCLEYLKLKNCRGYRRIDVTSRSVKELVFSNHYCCNGTSEDDFIDCIKINAPYISSLTIKGEFGLDLVLLDVSSLIKAELDYFIDPGMSDAINHEEMLRGLLESLDHVKDVIISDYLAITVGRFTII